MLLLATLPYLLGSTLAALSPAAREAIAANLEEVRSHSTGACPDKWLDASFVDMGCLLINSTKAYTWEGANSYCEGEENATLVEITSEMQFGFLQMQLKFLQVQYGVMRSM